MKISASFLAIKEPLKENLDLLTSTNIDYLHLDVMDGLFVKNKTWGYEETLDIINHKKPLDIHLMVDDVYGYVEKFSRLKPSFITFHYEVSLDIMDLIMFIKKENIKVGLSIKPETKVECLIPYLPFIDLVLVMSVDPGYGGQVFNEFAIEKINKLYEIKNNNSYNYLIEVDGGINDETIDLIYKADIAVIGSYITSGDYQERINNLK